MDKIYDVMIIGGGPAGYSAALYCTRAGLKTIVLEKLSAGGQIALTAQVDNYPGFEEGIDGFSLGEKMQAGAERFGAVTEYAEVYSLELKGDIKIAVTSEGEFRSRVVILATGAEPRNLGIEGEKELIGKGVNYCAACDGMFYKGKTVAVVGGGNTAVADILILSKIAKKVIVIHRRDTLRAEKIYHSQLEQTENVEFRWNSIVTELLKGEDGRLKGVRIEKEGSSEEIEIDGLFVSVGRKPSTMLVAGQLELDEAGYVAADETTVTSLPGVFAVGDVRTKALRQVVTAVADGAVSSHFALEYLAAK